MAATKKTKVEAFGKEWDMEKVENETKILNYLSALKLYDFVDKVETFVKEFVPNEEEKQQVLELLTKLTDPELQKQAIDEIIDRHTDEIGNAEAQA